MHENHAQAVPLFTNFFCLLNTLRECLIFSLTLKAVVEHFRNFTCSVTAGRGGGHTKKTCWRVLQCTSTTTEACPALRHACASCPAAQAPKLLTGDHQAHALGFMHLPGLPAAQFRHLGVVLEAAGWRIWAWPDMPFPDHRATQVLSVW